MMPLTQGKSRSEEWLRPHNSVAPLTNRRDVIAQQDKIAERWAWVSGNIQLIVVDKNPRDSRRTYREKLWPLSTGAHIRESTHHLEQCAAWLRERFHRRRGIFTTSTARRSVCISCQAARQL